MLLKDIRHGLPKVKPVALAIALLCGLNLAYADSVTYSQDPVLADFTSTIQSYGTFISGSLSNGGAVGIPGSNPYTPTTAILEAYGYPREIGNVHGLGPVVVDLGSGNSNASIVVFDNIDHPGNAWDVFQYQIWGSNDDSTWTSLFNPETASLVPSTSDQFTLTSYTGTAPTVLNNTLTPGAGSSIGSIGYEEYFTFGTAYQYYAFNSSTLDQNTGEGETELSAVGIATPSQEILDTAVPEPASLMYMMTGITGLIGFARRRRKI